MSEIKSLNVNNVSKSFGGNVIIDKFSFEFKINKLYCITGVSGSGKSTLLNMIGMLIPIDEGDISYDGLKWQGISSKNKRLFLRYRVGYLFQNYALIDHESVRSNLKVATRYLKQKRLKLDQVMDQVGLGDKLSRKVFTLSGGEQQRLAVARLLLKPTEIILADEPTGNLDEKNSRMVMEHLRNMKSDNIVIITTHDPVVLEYADEIIHIENID